MLLSLDPARVFPGSVRELPRLRGALPDRDLMTNEISLNSFLEQSLEVGASDMFLQIGLPPMVKVYGDLVPMEGRPVVTTEMMHHLVRPVLDESSLDAYRRDKKLDASYSLPAGGRFRVALLQQQNQLAGVFRQIPQTIPTLEELKAPRIIKEFAAQPRGLFIVTGPTGSGKSTTLAAAVNEINSTQRKHILTIEDPVEFLHKPKHCLINQREVPKDSPSFTQALDDSLREAPDVILLGELRNPETMLTAIKAAETGHLVMATLHTSSAPGSIDRLISPFPADQQNQIRTMIAASLVGIVAQTLIQTKDGKGRVAAHEILVADSAVRAQIRDGKTQAIRSEMVSKASIGNMTMDNCLAYLVAVGKISESAARAKVQTASDFESFMSAVKNGQEYNKPDLLGGGYESAISTE